MIDLSTSILATDAYKLDHRRQYPENTQYVYSNWTPRTSRVEEIDEVVFFGLQYFLDKYLGEEFGKFFAADVDEVCAEYERQVTNLLGPNQIGTDHIRELHNLGYIPLRFRAVPEGTSVPLKVPMLTVENTDPRFAWLVNYFETLLSSVLWMPCTTATTAQRMRALIQHWADYTDADVAGIDFQGHDFSMRGLPGVESAIISGMAHLAVFNGTDSVPAISAVERYYPTNSFIGGSVAATEHSVMCAGGQDDEQSTFERLLDLYPAGILSVVSDTWDLWKVLTEIVPNLKDRILARDGKLVIRPDSGDPVKIIVGDQDAEPGSPAYKGVVELLWDTFGGTETIHGFRVLDSHIGTIYGDSINYERANDIMGGLAAKGFASSNIVFGMGSFGYQYVTRDTFGFAMKATHVTINGEGKNIFKKPVTDNGGKFSAKGRVSVQRIDGKLTVVSEATPEQEADSLLKPVWQDGKFIKHWTFDEVRANVRGTR
jgi:nicotinamide phosphoribosyltransferase